MQAVESVTFNPSNRIFVPDVSDNYIKTHNNYRIDIGYFTYLCQKFRNLHHLKTKNLSGRNKEDFDMVVSYVHLLYGSQNYKHLHQIVERYFKDLEHVKPGTIGGYFAGCFTSSHSGCSVSCAGAIPRPRDEEGWGYCDKPVVFAEQKKKGGYNFSVLKKEDDMSICYLFVEQRDLHDFPGFSTKEKSGLKDMGIERVYLVGCDSDGRSYIDLYDGYRYLKDIKHKRILKGTDNDMSSLGLAIILLLVFFLLIVMFAGWRISARINKKS